MVVHRLIPAFAAIAAAFFVAALPAGPARALPAIEDFTSIGYQGTGASGSRTLGWIFTALGDIAVTHLGVWDQAGDGLLADHPVGIWDASGALLGMAIVRAGDASPAVGAEAGGGAFRYESAEGIRLDAGASYTIGALFDTDDVFEYYAIDVDTGPDVAFGEERYGDIGAGFVFPTDTFGRWGLFGPNFLYTSIAEPATSGLLLAGLAALAFAASGRRPRRIACRTAPAR
jgi:hypothetical protein